MKLKYQKLIFFLTLGIMGLGMATFSFTPDIPTSSDGTLDNDYEHRVDITPNNGKNPVTDDNLSLNKPTDAIYSPQPTITIHVVDNKLEKDAYPEINMLISDFLHAKLDSTSTYEGLVSNPRTLDAEQIADKSEVIKGYKNITCYTKKGINEIDYIVYVIYDTEILMLTALVPNMDEYHVTYNSNGNPVIYSENLSDETVEYLNIMRNGDDVTALRDNTNDRFVKAIDSDSELKDFFDKIYSPE